MWGVHGSGIGQPRVVRLPDGGLLMFVRVVSVFSHVAEVAIFSAAAVALTLGMLALR